MRSLLRSVIVVATAAVTFTACTDEQPSRLTAPPRPSAAVATALTLTCDINGLKANARDYATSNKDLLFTIIGDLQSLARTQPPNSLDTDKAFDGLARLAAMRNTSAQKSTATGAVFDGLTTGFLGCMEDWVKATVPGDFTVAGALGPDKWMYEVRGKASDGANSADQHGASPYWTLQAPNGWGASIAATSQAKRFLVYGQPSDFVPKDATIGGAFDIKTIPTIASGKLSFSSDLLVGLCDYDPVTSARVQHVETVLMKKSLVCPNVAPSMSQAASGFRPLQLAQRALAFFAPKTAYAAMFFGGVGGAVSELSPSVVIDMQQTTLKYMFAIVDGRNSRPLQGTDGGPVKILVTTKGGQPLSGVSVKLEVLGNNSVIAFFNEGGSDVTSVTRTSGTDGIASFDGVRLTKAGGYQLTASGSFDNVPGQAVTSNSFNIQNK